MHFTILHPRWDDCQAFFINKLNYFNNINMRTYARVMPSPFSRLNSPFPLEFERCLWYNRRMRVDKFLKLSRIIKRRTVANEACDASRVLVNGKSAKPSKEVKVGDVIGVRFGDKEAYFKVLVIPTGNVGKSDATTLYEIVNEVWFSNRCRWLRQSRRWR